MGKGFANTTLLFLEEDEREGRASRPNDTRDGSWSLYADRKPYVSFQIWFYTKHFLGDIEDKSKEDQLFLKYILLFILEKNKRESAVFLIKMTKKF